MQKQEKNKMKIIYCLIIISLLTPLTSYAGIDNYARDKIRMIERKLDKLPENLVDKEWRVIDKQGSNRYTFFFVIENVLGVRKVISMNSKCTIIVGDKVNYIPQNNKFFFIESEQIERIK